MVYLVEYCIMGTEFCTVARFDGVQSSVSECAGLSSDEHRAALALCRVPLGVYLQPSMLHQQGKESNTQKLLLKV